MDRLRQLISEIGERLGTLGVSQRIAIALCAALVAGSIFWLLQWSTTPEYVPLTTQELTWDQLDAAEQAIKTNGAKYQVRGTRIYVRATDRHNLLRILHVADALPGDTLLDMGQLIETDSPFMAPEARRNAAAYAKGNELAKIIATSKIVDRARVIINDKTTRRLGGRSDVPTATVLVHLKPGRTMTQSTVAWLANFVSGAVSGLKPHNVSVSDARGRSYKVPHPDDAFSTDYLGRVKEYEEHLTSKIHEALQHIHGVLATVTVELDTTKRSVTKVTYAEVQPKKETTKEEQTGSSGGATESGVTPNTGTALAASTGGRSSSVEETATDFFDAQRTGTETIEQMPLAMKHVTATVNIPRSFIVRLYKLKNAGEESPTDEQLQPDRDAQIKRVKAVVALIVQAATPDDVEVDVYPDLGFMPDGTMAWGLSPGGVMTASGMMDRQAGTLEMVEMYGPQAGLGLLAMFSLFLMMRIVRKTQPTRKTVQEADSHELEGGELHVGPVPVGQAMTGETFLTGKELDEETLRYRELGDEVSKLVEDDPNSAADLIRRWVQDTD